MKIDFSKMPYAYWSEKTKVSYLQRMIVVYSYMYYELNESCISDPDYDELSKQLIKMQKEMDPEDFKKTDCYYCMYDFDGTTGFDLPSRLNEQDKERISKIAFNVLKSWKGKKEET